MLAKMKGWAAYGWSWLRWPYDICKEAKAKLTLWITNTKAWKWLESKEYDPPAYPLSWWATRGALVVLLLAGSHWWSYKEGKSAAAFATAWVSPSRTQIDSDLRVTLAASNNSLKRWKAIAMRLDSDNEALNLRINEMRAMAGEKSNMAGVAPKHKTVVRKRYKKTAKAKPTVSTWLSGP